jgi:transcriptional regulator with XRE-family HTH domain
MAKTNVQAIELGRSAPPIERYEALAAALGVELVVQLRTEGAQAEEAELLSAFVVLDSARRGLLLRLAHAIPDVDDAMLRGAVEGLEGWARAGRASRAIG